MSPEAELLLVPECAHGAEAAELFRGALEAAGLDPTFATTLVTTQDDARGLSFVGSPTFLLDGADLFAGSDPPAVACRMYATASGLRGLPEHQDLVRALVWRSTR